MPTSRSPYPLEFRAEAVRLVRSGERNPEELARDLGCSAQAIRNWVKQADMDEGRRSDGLTTAERDDLRLRAERRALERERTLLEKSCGLGRSGERPDPVTVFRFIQAEQASFPIAFMCRRLGVSTSGYYAWLRRGPSARTRADAELTELIRAIHRRSNGAYGAPRIHAELAEVHGVRCARKRVARLMRAVGLAGGRPGGSAP